MENGLNYQEFVGTDDNQCCPSCGCKINPMDMTCRYCGEALVRKDDEKLDKNAYYEIKNSAVKRKTLKKKAKTLGFKKSVSRYYFIALIVLLIATSFLSSNNIPEFIRKIPGKDYIGWMIIIDLIALVIIAVIAIIRGKKLENKARLLFSTHPVRSHHYSMIKNDLSIFRIGGYYSFRNKITDDALDDHNDDITGVNSIIGIRNNYIGALWIFIMFVSYMSFGKMFMAIQNGKHYEYLLAFTFFFFFLGIPGLYRLVRWFANKRINKLLKSVYIGAGSYSIFGQAVLSKNTKYSYEESEKILWCYLLDDDLLNLQGFSIGAAVLKSEEEAKKDSSDSGCSSCSSCGGGCGGGCGGCGD